MALLVNNLPPLAVLMALHSQVALLVHKLQKLQRIKIGSKASSNAEKCHQDGSFIDTLAERSHYNYPDRKFVDQVYDL